MNRSLGGPKRRCGLFGEDKIFCPCPDSNTRPSSPYLFFFNYVNCCFSVYFVYAKFVTSKLRYMHCWLVCNCWLSNPASHVFYKCAVYWPIYAESMSYMVHYVSPGGWMLNGTYTRPPAYLFSLYKYIILKESTYVPLCRLETYVIQFSVWQPS